MTIDCNLTPEGRVHPVEATPIDIYTILLERVRARIEIEMKFLIKRFINFWWHNPVPRIYVVIIVWIKFFGQKCNLFAPKMIAHSITFSNNSNFPVLFRPISFQPALRKHHPGLLLFTFVVDT